MYVSTHDGLEKLVGQMAGSPVIAIDTEFLREKTYYAKLCLVQVATDDIEAIIDPLAVKDLSPLASLLAAPETMKVFHAGSQDIEILLHATGEIPHPLFDTQVAASIMGHQHQIGYGALVKELVGVDLPKADSLTDWTRRPLTDTQLDYAVDDVRYLPSIYRTMEAELKRLGRFSWTDADFSRLTDPKSYENDPMEAWRRVKRISSLSRKQLAVAQVVAAWREETAQKRDLPRRWVLADEVLIEIARRMPTKPDDILSLRGVSGRIGLSTVRELLERINSAIKSDPSTWPSISRSHGNGVDTEAAVDLMTALVHLRARQHNVSASLLAPHDDIVKLAHGQTEGVSLVEGWRKPLIGDDLLALLSGELSLSIEGHHLAVTDREAAAKGSAKVTAQRQGDGAKDAGKARLVP